MFISIVFFLVLCVLNYATFRLLRAFLTLKKISQYAYLGFFILLCVGEGVFAFYKNAMSSHLFVLTSACSFITFILFVFALSFYGFSYSIEKIDFLNSRRKSLKNFLKLGFYLALLGYFWRGFYEGLARPKIKETPIYLDKLDKELKVILLTDMHVGRLLQSEFVTYIVEEVNQKEVDMVLIGGDLVDDNIEKVKSFLLPLNNLKSTYGTFYVPGNHEYYHGIEPILSFLKTLNITILGNECVDLNGINLCGVYDYYARKHKNFAPNIDKALQKRDINKPTILLAHQPKQIKSIKETHSIDLMLSGHTHAGQIFPFSLLVKLAQTYLYGLYKHSNTTQIYVSSGAGYWGVPLRFLAPSEIAYLRLLPKKA
ncbi:metallophosphoesterase [Helicobacter cetorum]|uniref:metallophosphoesterase n=1 Tax=Helicobacter cetorum TaxID=138563 RepID=UPI000CF1030E|nr:metallophosphoesterase [Helicobacter cetorum]